MSENLVLDVKTEDYCLSEVVLPNKRPKLEEGIHSLNIDTKTKSKKYKKREERDEHNLSGYNRKFILKHLQEHGCSTHGFNKALKSFKVPTEIATKFFNRHLKEAEAHVYQECDSICFEHMNEWLRLFKAHKIPEKCRYEPALVMSAIVHNEEQPNPADLNGIDLKSIYQFLSNALLGQPQPELNKESAAFLTNEFTRLIDEANTELADQQTRILKALLRLATMNSNVKHNLSSSLDPFHIQKFFNTKTKIEQ